ncbi:hypothetical protein A2V82_16440 [candidate division KSB1 bacterium RBG_16_48_16]|nr:MAG: hypothetical protein A2V82_16440 [candidate division KSB1 bacterium RBG_16_48_16]
MKWLDDIKAKDLPEQYHEMAEAIGVENTLKLAKMYPKQVFYFVGLDAIEEKKKKEYIRKKFNGSNHKELAKATDYSERWVYEILKPEKEDKQAGLFDEK